MSIQRILAGSAIATGALAASAPAAHAGSSKALQDPVFLMGLAICVFVGLFVVSIWAYRESQRDYPPNS